MGVYIKDLKKPENCDICPIFLVFTTCGCDRDHCMFQEVPEPHGDLIDRHEAYLRFGKLAETLEERNGYEAGAPYAMAAMFLNNANEFPTVIPASEDGET